MLRLPACLGLPWTPTACLRLRLPALDLDCRPSTFGPRRARRRLSLGSHGGPLRAPRPQCLLRAGPLDGPTAGGQRPMRRRPAPAPQAIPPRPCGILIAQTPPTRHDNNLNDFRHPYPQPSGIAALAGLVVVLSLVGSSPRAVHCEFPTRESKTTSPARGSSLVPELSIVSSLQEKAQPQAPPGAVPLSLCFLL
jgi:hypothetical protein